MRVSYSQIENEARQAVETECERYVAKLEKLLKRYDPDLVQLHCTLEKTPRRTEFGVSLRLTMPTASLQATGRGGDARIATKAAFAELEGQLKKHQSKLRKDYTWKRKRGSRATLKPGEAASAN